MIPGLSKLLETAGIKTESLVKIQFGQGVVNSSAYVALAALAVIGVIGYHLTNDYLSFLVICGVAGGFYWFIRKILTFAKDNPELALMGGTTYFAWKQAELASKDLPIPPETPAIINPTTSGESLVQLEDKK